MSNNQPDPDVESAAARRLAEALDLSAIDALLADAKTAGTSVSSPTDSEHPHEATRA